MQPRNVRLLPLLPFVLLIAACGSEANDSSRWIGHTFLLNIPATNWSEPRGIGGDIGGFVPQFLFSVARGAAAQDLEVTIGTSVGGVQDPCNPTTKVTASGADYPASQIVAHAFPLHILDTNQTPNVVVDTTVHDFSFKNILPGGAGSGKEGEVTATIDAAEVYPLFRLIPMPSKESVCKALGSAGATCAACAHNGEPFCLTIKAVQLAGTQSAVALKSVAVDDVPASCRKP